MYTSVLTEMLEADKRLKAAIERRPEFKTFITFLAEQADEMAKIRESLAVMLNFNESIKTLREVAERVPEAIDSFLEVMNSESEEPPTEDKQSIQ